MLIDAAKEFIKDREYVSASEIQRALFVGYPKAQAIIQALVDAGLIDSDFNKTGKHKVYHPTIKCGIKFSKDGSQAALALTTMDDLKELVGALARKGFTILHGLDHIKDGDCIVAVVVDFKDRVMFQSGVTPMACWCQEYGKPSTVKEFLDYLRNHGEKP